MMMFKRILFASALVSTAAFAQQVDISGKDFLSGAGDARLAEIARQAAASGKKLVVKAPPYWQGKVAAKLQAGAANVSVQMTEGFVEDVLVHLEDSKATPAKAEAAAVETPKADAPKADTAKADAAKAAALKAEAAKAEAARVEAARVEAAKAEAARAEAAKADAARAETTRVEAAKAEAARVEEAKAAAARAEIAKAEAAKAAAAKAEANRIAAIKQGMEKNLNEGRPADGTMAVAQLEKDDVVFVNGDIRSVVRRAGAHTQLYWLEGELNLDRIELLPTGDNRYKVNEPIRNVANPTLRVHEAAQHFIANMPAPDSAERKSLQQQYADGKDVTGSLHPSDLRQGDTVYTGKGAALVTRRAGLDLLRYWLDGDLNLGQTGINKQAAGAYRVMTDTIK
jgi:hypothetical protein